ncbi:MAG: hypothetical protein WAX04_04670, partial [Oscillospiraceae bacterium]
VFKDYIDLCDVCINLRYPYGGETSGSLMRVIASGKPSIITDIGSFSEIPKDCCFKISAPNNSINLEYQDLVGILSEILSNKNIIKEKSLSCIDYADKILDINIVKQQYRDYILEDIDNCVTEKLLDEIYIYEIKCLSDREKKTEIELIANTLAMIK